MGVLIDSTVLIEAERGRLSLEPLIASRVDEDFFLSVVSASELLRGIHRAGDPGKRARRAAITESVLDSFPILPIDLATARTHAFLWAELARVGKPIGPNDLWIAATAITHGLSVATANLREFERVPGLTVEHWAGS